MNVRAIILTCATCIFCSLSAGSDDAQKKPTIDLGSHRPLIAVWCNTLGFRPDPGPYLRIAIYKDDRVLFAKDPTKREGQIREGEIASQRISDLEKRITGTGVFKLKGNCYLMPDGRTDCIMVDLGNKQQMLYWDEADFHDDGTNVDATAAHVKFKECWNALNRLALNYHPSISSAPKGRIDQLPRTWFLKEAIESE